MKNCGPFAVLAILGSAGVLGSLGGAFGCSRAGEAELLKGKACTADTDCVSGYSCDAMRLVCVLASSQRASGGATSGGAPNLGGMSSTLGGRAPSGGSGGFGGAMMSGLGGAATGGVGGPATGGVNSSGGVAALSGGSNSGGSGAGLTGGTGAGGTSGGGAASGGTPSMGGTGGAGPVVCTPACAQGRTCMNGTCQKGWVSMSAPPGGFVGRSQAAYTVMGQKLFVWGGVDQNGINLNSGAIYDPGLDTWQATAVSANTPSARVLATAVWTGSQVIVWGGRTADGAAEYKNGAFYDPVNNAWQPLPKDPMVARSGSIGFAYGNAAFFTLGWTRNGSVLDKGAQYQILGQNWFNATNDLLGRLEHPGFAVEGSKLYVVGGLDEQGQAQDAGAVYDMTTNGWTLIKVLPGRRYGAFSAYSGSRLWVWGGRDNNDVAATPGLTLEGGNLGTWTAIATAGQPTNRWAPQRRSGWAFAIDADDFALLAGRDLVGVFKTDGGVYDRAQNTWSGIPAWPSGLAHEWGVGAWVNGQFITWGGLNNGTTTLVGERWAP